jgi:tRNA-Thr(GGU) m(6)t(6)A37 methyltransferase TsaA
MGLTDFSHLWLVFVFHQAMQETWRPTVRPPRLGGNERMGVFASRAPYRPNPIGLSVVVLDDIEQRDGGLFLHLSGVDLVDGTPVLDIKPYVPYTDALPHAQSGFAPAAPEPQARVTFSPLAQAQVEQAKGQYPELQILIEKIIGLDPRPAYYHAGSSRRQFGMKLWDWDVRWTVDGETACVTELVPVDDPGA